MSWTIKTAGSSPSVHQTSHGLLRETLLDALLAAVGPRSGGIGSVQCRASAALYALLGEHSIDRRGRCRRCRGPRPLLGRARRVCRVLVAARFYLHQPDDVLLSHLVDPADPPEQRPHTPAVSPPACPGRLPSGETAGLRPRRGREGGPPTLPASPRTTRSTAATTRRQPR